MLKVRLTVASDYAVEALKSLGADKVSFAYLAPWRAPTRQTPATLLGREREREMYVYNIYICICTHEYIYKYIHE